MGLQSTLSVIAGQSPVDEHKKSVALALAFDVCNVGSIAVAVCVLKGDTTLLKRH